MEKVEGEIDMNTIDDMLPGFRFHPTDEELVGFYLKRKIQHRTLPIELIKQVDIYKYDPWDLPKLACSGEKEWYFYCPRDRKYRNSARPNRVTVAGFWKATGTDRPIYSSNGIECIGLKKSLVFYRGRAAKGIKTDWMMHEFRLPSTATSAPLPKNVSDQILSLNDSWAICRIFKKTNTIAQRALSRSRLSQIHDATSSDRILNQGAHYNLFSPEPISADRGGKTTLGLCTIETSSPIQLPNYNPIIYKINPTLNESYPFPFSTEYISPLELSKSAFDITSMPFNTSQQVINSVDIDQLQDKKLLGLGKKLGVDYSNNAELVGFPFDLSSNGLDTWNSDFIWDSSSYSSDISATFSTNQCNS